MAIAGTSVDEIVNVGRRLNAMASQMPNAVAVVEPRPKKGSGPRRYRQVTFRELDDDTTRIAAGFGRMGIQHGTRLVLLVRPSIDFVSLVFALFKAGVVMVLIDPGIGRKHLVQCLADAEPEGFVAIPKVQAIRVLLRRRFPRAKFFVTLGRRWFWGGTTVEELRRTDPGGFVPAATKGNDPAAIIFTSGSTGAPKGVLYLQRTFDRQVDEIRDFYEIQPGETDVPGFPLFALFNCVMGVTTVIPEMDFAQPAKADPRNIVEAVRDWQATQAFGSPALWNVVGRHCETHHEKLPSLKRVLSAGAPVPPHVLRRMKQAIHPIGDVHTPYGATEALPVASISASEVLGETAARSSQGAGTCVGRHFPGIDWKVIRITDEPIGQIADAAELPRREIGELVVQGAVVTRQYVTHVEANAMHKIQDGTSFWHRMGDVGYLDERDRFWFCGRKSHRIVTGERVMFTIPCESIFNQHPRIYRSALVGVGPRGDQKPVIVAEAWPDKRPTSPEDEHNLVGELLALAAAHDLTRAIDTVLFIPALPVDVRHNSKIFREQVAQWAAKGLSASLPFAPRK